MRREVLTDEYLTKLHPLVIERFEAFEQFFDKFSFFFNGSLDYQNINVIPKSKDTSEMKKMIWGASWALLSAFLVAKLGFPKDPGKIFSLPMKSTAPEFFNTL